MNFGKFWSPSEDDPSAQNTNPLDSDQGVPYFLRARKEKTREILRYYRALYGAWGPQHWWPAKTRFEVIVGAYLTQNTAWANVERAIANLRAKHLLSPTAIDNISVQRLEKLIRSSGYYRQKARK